MNIRVHDRAARQLRRCKTSAPGHGRCVRRAGHPGQCVLPLPAEAKNGNVLDVDGIWCAMREGRAMRAAREAQQQKPREPA